jgi:Zn-dependent protease
MPGPGADLIASIIGLAVAVIFHEVAHGYVALWLGDPTAKYAGRLTLNPINHIDMWGTILFPLILILSGTGFVFGWAKPVPVNYYNLRNQKYDPLLVALAGPAMNFILLMFFGLLTRLSDPATSLPLLWANMALINSALMLFNLIPIPPLDGSKVLYLFLYRRPEIVALLEQYGFFILLFLMFAGAPLLNQFIFAPALLLTRFFTGV